MGLGLAAPAATALLALANLVQLLWPAVRERIVSTGDSARETCQAADQCLEEVRRLSRNDSYLRVNVGLGVGNLLAGLALACWACRGRGSKGAAERPRVDSVPAVAVPSSSQRFSEWAPDSDSELATYVPPKRKGCR